MTVTLNDNWPIVQSLHSELKPTGHKVWANARAACCAGDAVHLQLVIELNCLPPDQLSDHDDNRLGAAQHAVRGRKKEKRRRRKKKKKEKKGQKNLPALFLY